MRQSRKTRPISSYRTLASGGSITDTSYNRIGDGIIQLWDLKKGGEPQKNLSGPSFGHFVHFSPDGRTLAMDYDTSIKLYDLEQLGQN